MFTFYFVILLPPIQTTDVWCARAEPIDVSFTFFSLPLYICNILFATIPFYFDVAPYLSVSFATKEAGSEMFDTMNFTLQVDVNHVNVAIAIGNDYLIQC